MTDAADKKHKKYIQELIGRSLKEVDQKIYQDILTKLHQDHQKIDHQLEEDILHLMQKISGQNNELFTSFLSSHFDYSLTDTSLNKPAVNWLNKSEEATEASGPHSKEELLNSIRQKINLVKNHQQRMKYYIDEMVQFQLADEVES